MAGRGAKQGKKAAKTYERPGLSEEEIEEIKEAFNLFDTDGSGMCLSLCATCSFAPACSYFFTVQRCLGTWYTHESRRPAMQHPSVYRHTGLV